MFQNLAITIPDLKGDVSLRIAACTGGDELIMSINGGDEFEFWIKDLYNAIEAIIQFQKANSR